MDFTFNKFCVRILKGMSKGSRACVNFEGKIRTQNLLKVKSELYTTAARTTFPKKDGRICALVPQKARAWAVTSLAININRVVERRYCTFLA